GGRWLNVNAASGIVSAGVASRIAILRDAASDEPVTPWRVACVTPLSSARYTKNIDPNSTIDSVNRRSSGVISAASTRLAPDVPARSRRSLRCIGASLRAAAVQPAYRRFAGGA